MILSTRSSHPQSRSFVLKLQRESHAGQGRLIGRLEHLASGRLFHFTSADELIAHLAACESAPERREGDA
jgi:hypothetical protein